MIPKDIFFQFKKHQPFKFSKPLKSQKKIIQKPPRTHTHIAKEYPQESLGKKNYRPSSQCSSYRVGDFFDFPAKSSVNTSKIEKTSEKILSELDFLLDKENRYSITPVTTKEKEELCKEYKHVSQRISSINRGRVPLKNIKVEMYRKDH